MKIAFDLIVAMDVNSGIGKAGGLPWYLPADVRRFKELTSNTQSPDKKNVVVMGRKTWESLPQKFRPLPNRVNIVLTRDQIFSLPKDVLRIHSFAALSKILVEMSERFEKIFVIGGANVFEQAMKHPDSRAIYVTQISKKFDCDTFFPPIVPPWHEVYKSTELFDQSIPYRFLEYRKKSD